MFINNSNSIAFSRRLLFALLPLITILTLTHAGAAAQGVDRRVVARAGSITGDAFDHAARTPRGAVVYAVSRPAPATLEAVDRGLAALFDVARRRGYRARLNHRDYVIFIARADRQKDASGQYSPDIALPAGQYANSGYDQGGFIYAAGYVLAYTPAALIVAEHENQLNRLADVVRYEGEHIVLYHNDRDLYQKTADHSRGGGHPILQ